MLSPEDITSPEASQVVNFSSLTSQMVCISMILSMIFKSLSFSLFKGIQAEYYVIRLLHPLSFLLQKPTDSESFPLVAWRFNACLTVLLSSTTPVMTLAESTVHTDASSNTMGLSFLNLYMSINFVLNPTSTTYFHNPFLEFIVNNCKLCINSVLRILPAIISNYLFNSCLQLFFLWKVLQFQWINPTVSHLSYVSVPF